MAGRFRASIGRILFAALMVALLAVPAAQNATRPASPPVFVTGRVVDDQTSLPVPNARVTTSVTVVGAPVVLSDQDGRFSLSIPPGLNELSVNKTGYAKRGAAVPNANGAIEVRLARGAAISGRITDVQGNSAVTFRMRIETKAPDGKRSTVAQTLSDDRGDYRVGGLAAGDYFVSFVPVVQRLMVVTGPGGPATQVQRGEAGMTEPFFYPGVSSADEARPITLRAGDERTDVDLLLPSTDTGTDLMDQQRILMEESRSSEPGGPSGLPPTRTATVRGRVLDRDGRPLNGALVRILTPSFRMTTTDKDGWYEFRELPAGNTRVAATKTGYFSNVQEYGGRAPNAPSFALKDGETRGDVEIRLDKWSAIEGRVVDERGEPMADAVVQLLQIKYEAGRRSLVRVDIWDPKTDDRGRFRMHGVPAGQFIVSAVVNEVSSAELPGYARAYYPATPDASAALWIPVSVGAEVGGIDVGLARMRTWRVSGTIRDAAGRPTDGVSLLLYPHGSAYGEPAGARIERDGTFEFRNVAPGRYVIQAGFGTGPGSSFAALPVTVDDADIAGLTVQPAPSSRIAGRILFAAGSGRLPARQNIGLTVYPQEPLMLPLNRLPRAAINGDWTFEMAGVTGTGRLALTNLPQGWALESIRVGGADVTDRPLVFDSQDRSMRDVEVTLTDRLSTVTGTVVDDRQRPLGGVPVIAYSADSAAWYPSSRFFQAGTTTPAGAFTIRGLPSGLYNVVAVSSLPTGGSDAWQDPQYLDSLALRSTKVTVTEGLPATVQPLRLLSR